MKTSYGSKLLPYLRPYRLRFLWALAQVFLITGFELLKPWPLQVVIDNVLGGKAVGFARLEGWSPLGLLGLACLGIVEVQFVAGALTLLHSFSAEDGYGGPRRGSGRSRSPAVAVCGSHSQRRPQPWNSLVRKTHWRRKTDSNSRSHRTDGLILHPVS